MEKRQRSSEYNFKGSIVSKIVIAIFFVSFAQMAESFSCGNVLSLESSGLLNYLATVKFKTPAPLHEEQWVMEIQTDHEFTFLGGWDMWVMNKPAEGKSTFKSRDENITLAQGEELTFRFRIQWFTDEPIPEVISMIWQGHQICRNDTSSAQAITALRRRRTDERAAENSGSRIRASSSRRRMRLPLN